MSIKSLLLFFYWDASNEEPRYPESLVSCISGTTNQCFFFSLSLFFSLKSSKLKNISKWFLRRLPSIDHLLSVRNHLLSIPSFLRNGGNVYFVMALILKQHPPLASLYRVLLALFHSALQIPGPLCFYLALSVLKYCLLFFSSRPLTSSLYPISPGKSDEGIQ